MSGVLSSFALPYLLLPLSAPTYAERPRVSMSFWSDARPHAGFQAHQQKRGLASHATGHPPAVALDERIGILPATCV